MENPIDRLAQEHGSLPLFDFYTQNKNFSNDNNSEHKGMYHSQTQALEIWQRKMTRKVKWQTIKTSRCSIKLDQIDIHQLF